MVETRRALLAAAASCAASALGCRPGGVTLRGAGATLPAVQYGEWARAYEASSGVEIDYLPIGSGGGIRQLSNGTVDFGATDVELDAVERELLRAEVLSIPTSLVTIGVVYNLPLPGLRFSRESLRAIYRGEIQRWSDARLAADNPELSLPDRPIAVISRSDGGGSTALFSRYLARSAAGRGARFSVGIGARGSGGMVDVVADLPGSIGYVEAMHASRAKLSLARIEGELGRFSAADEPDYALVSPTYLIVPRRFRELEKGSCMARFCYWILTEGQQMLRAAPLERLTPLPPSLARAAVDELRTMTSGSSDLLRID